MRRATGAWLVLNHVPTVRMEGCVTSRMEPVCVHQATLETSVRLVGHSCSLSDPAGHLFMTHQQLYICTSVINFYDSFSLHPMQSVQMAGLVLAASFSALVRTATAVIPSQASVYVMTAGLEPTVKRVKTLCCCL